MTHLVLSSGLFQSFMFLKWFSLIFLLQMLISPLKKIEVTVFLTFYKFQ